MSVEDKLDKPVNRVHRDMVVNREAAGLVELPAVFLVARQVVVQMATPALLEAMALLPVAAVLVGTEETQEVLF